ncbi:MAG: hypothetical protein CMH49_01395 [Myxococcales bacterium]|nr:hypothetical protein [Myxococcales bacterium]
MMRLMGLTGGLVSQNQSRCLTSKLCHRSLHLAVLAALFLSTSVWAKSNAVLIPLKNSKEVKGSTEKSINIALAKSLKTKVSLANVAKVAQTLKTAGCKGSQCKNSAMKVAQGANARFVFIPSLVNEFDIFALQIFMLDADHPNVAPLELKETCEFCSNQDLVKKFKTMLSSEKVNKMLSREGKPKGPSTFTLSVVTSPPNAEVLVNGVSKGRSPLNIKDLKSEKYQLEVTLKGYVSEKKTLTPPTPLPTKSISESFTLKPKAPKSFPIIIKTKPKGALVVLDKVKIKVRTPFKAKVKPGSHEITFSLAGYEDYTKTFSTPAQEETISLNVTLKKIAPKVVAKPEVKQATPKPVNPVTAQSNIQPSLGSTAPPRPSLLASNWSGAALGVGTIMTGVGAWLLSVHGEITCNDGRTRKTCPEVYNTKIAAGTLLGMGTAAIGASMITLLIRSEWPQKSVKGRVQPQARNYIPMITPTQDGAKASFTFSF